MLYLLDVAPPGHQVDADAPGVPHELEAVEIEVLPPSGPAEAKARRGMRDLQHAFLIYAPEVFRPDAHAQAIAEILRFTEEHPDSRPATLAQLFLAYAPLAKARWHGHTGDLQACLSTLRSFAEDRAFPLRLKAEQLRDEVERVSESIRRSGSQTAAAGVGMPSQPSPRSLEAQSREAVSAAIAALEEALESRDRARIAAAFSDDFRFAGRLDKQQYLRELTQELPSEVPEGDLDVRLSIESSGAVQDGAEAVVTMESWIGGKRIAEPRPYYVRLKRAEHRWLITSWAPAHPDLAPTVPVGE